MPVRLHARPLATLAVAGVAALLVGVAAWPEPGSELAAADRPVLSDDDGDRPLFDVPALAPGDRVRRCIRVRHNGEVADDIGVRARTDGPLAERVRLTVARADGDVSDCASLDGVVVFRGTLAGSQTELADARPWRAGAEDVATYRLTLAAPDDLAAQDSSASVDFRWVALAQTAPVPDAGRPPVAEAPGSPPPSAQVPAPALTPAPTVAQPAPAAPDPSPTAGTRGTPKRPDRGKPRGGDRRPAPASRRPSGRTPGPAPAGPDAKRGDANSDTGLRDTLRRVARVVGEAVRAAAERAAFPVLLILAMLLFLLFQNRLDSRDPKLALAPVQGSPDLAFAEPDDD